MTILDLIDMYAASSGKTKKESEELFRGLFDTLGEALDKIGIDERIKISGFGSFYKTYIPERRGGDLQNGGVRTFAPSSKICFLRSHHPRKLTKGQMSPYAAINGEDDGEYYDDHFYDT